MALVTAVYIKELKVLSSRRVYQPKSLRAVAKSESKGQGTFLLRLLSETGAQYSSFPVRRKFCDVRNDRISGGKSHQDARPPAPAPTPAPSPSSSCSSCSCTFPNHWTGNAKIRPSKRLKLLSTLPSTTPPPPLFFSLVQSSIIFIPMSFPYSLGTDSVKVQLSDNRAVTFPWRK